MDATFHTNEPEEQDVVEDMMNECIDFAGTELYYIPRTLIDRDHILNEDRLSEFKNAYMIKGYLDQIDNFEGSGAFIQKFGLALEQSATFTIAKRMWNQLVGSYGETILPNRPAEGDLIYWPITKGLFEIKFVTHQNPFYQLGKLYVYKLEVELFQYSSEKIDTGIPAIDMFEDLKSHDISIIPNQGPSNIKDIVQSGDQITVILNGTQERQSDPIIVAPQQSPTPVIAGDNDKFKVAATDINYNATNIFGD